MEITPVCSDARQWRGQSARRKGDESQSFRDALSGEEHKPEKKGGDVFNCKRSGASTRATRRSTAW